MDLADIYPRNHILNWPDPKCKIDFTDCFNSTIVHKIHSKKD